MKQKMKLIFQHDDYEVCLRRIMCISLSIEALLIYASACDRILPEKQLFYIHTEGFISLIGGTMFLMLIPVVLTTLSLFSKSAYYLYEILHFLVGGLFFIALLWILMEIAIILFLLFWGRIIIYSYCMKRHSKKLKNNV